MTSSIKTTFFALFLLMALGAGQSAAQIPPPDCSGQGQNLVGLVWENSEFSSTADAFQQQTATLYIFNPSLGDVRGWELALDLSSTDIILLGTTYYGNGLNVGIGNIPLSIEPWCPSLPSGHR